MSASFEPDPKRSTSGALRGVAIAALFVCIAAVAYFLFVPGAWRDDSASSDVGGERERETLRENRDERAAAQVAAATAPKPRPVPPTDPGAASAPPLPPPPSVIRDAPGFVAEWAERITPRIPSEWIEIEDPFERVVAATNAIVLGEDPMRQLKFLRPSGRFEPGRDQSGALVLPANLDARYERFLAVFQAIDPDLTAEAFRLAEPSLDRSHQALGYPKGRFRRVLLEAIATLRSTPEPKRPVELVAKSVTFAYADPALEALDPAQRVLLRLSPAARQRVLRKLEAIAASVARLPEPGRAAEQP